jgi:hypothetical protein
MGAARIALMRDTHGAAKSQALASDPLGRRLYLDALLWLADATMRTPRMECLTEVEVAAFALATNVGLRAS